MIKKILCPFPDSKQNCFFILWVLHAILLSCLPSIYAYISAPNSTNYNWLIPPYPEDGLSYMAWVKQAADGNLLFKIKFTSVEHARFLFHPLFLLCGLISMLTGLGSDISLLIGRIISIALFFYVLRYFLEQLNIRGRAMWLSLILLTYASGLGWLVPQYKSIDLTAPGIITTWANSWLIIYPFTRSLILLAFTWFLQALNESGSAIDRKKAIGAGVMVGLLAFVHPYDIVFTSLIIVLTTIFIPKKWSVLIWFSIFALPAIGIQFAISQLHPVVSAHSSAKMMSPAPLSYFLAMGVPGILAFCCLVFNKWLKGSEKLKILVIWILSSFCLAYVPIWFQAKMVGGVHIPVCIMAAVFVDRLLQRYTTKTWVQYLLVLLIILPTLPNHSIVIESFLQELKTGKAYYYRPQSLEQALLFLDNNSEPDEVVLAALKTSAHIPGISGNTVVYGHWAQSVDQDEKMQWLGRFVYVDSGSKTRQECIDILKKQNIDYILIDPALKYSIGNFGATKLAEFGDVVFRNKEVTIVKVN